MNSEDLFNSRDQMFIAACLSEYKRRFNCEYPLTVLVDAWGKFVNDVESGYPYSIFDYINDLSVRDVIDRCFIGLSSEGKDILLQIIKPLDDRLVNTSFLIDRPLSKRQRWLPGWWYYRIPRRLKEPLRTDLIDQSVSINDVI